MNLNPLFNHAIKKGSQIINYQSVRWRRVKKPFWLGLAKSKMFVIPGKEKVLTDEETQVYKELKANYKTHYKSIINFIRNESPLRMDTLEDDIAKKKSDLEDKIALSFKANEEWNAESRRLGNEWAEKAFEMEAEKAQKMLEERNLKEANHQEKLNEIIRREKALSKNFITPENVDEAIENCLKTVEQFDFAIDLQGNKYFGQERFTKKVNTLAEVTEKQSQFVTETK